VIDHQHTQIVNENVNQTQTPKNYVKNLKRKKQRSKEGGEITKNSQLSITSFNSLGFIPCKKRKRSTFMAEGWKVELWSPRSPYGSAHDHNWP